MTQKRAPGTQWVKILRYYHGMRPEQWQAMFQEQDGLCYLCERPLPASRLHVAIDHDHSCCPAGQSCGFCRRGLACRNCNSGIGMFGDDPAQMRVVAGNLEHAQELTRALLITKPEQPDLYEESSA